MLHTSGAIVRLKLKRGGSCWQRADTRSEQQVASLRRREVIFKCHSASQAPYRRSWRIVCDSKNISNGSEDGAVRCSSTVISSKVSRAIDKRPGRKDRNSQGKPDFEEWEVISGMSVVRKYSQRNKAFMISEHSQRYCICGPIDSLVEMQAASKAEKSFFFLNGDVKKLRVKVVEQ